MIFVSYLLSFNTVCADITFNEGENEVKASYDPAFSTTIFQLFTSEMEQPGQMIKEVSYLIELG